MDNQAGGVTLGDETIAAQKPDSARRPLAGIKVVDFSTLLPGPMASLILADAGAEVVKIESPEGGDGMRHFEPKLGGVSANFVLLNRGKSSRSFDLKDREDHEAVMCLLAEADVLIEGFRPGVMNRLGLSYDALRERNPGLIYCSITGYGQVGARALMAGHDLNYMAEVGLLSLVADQDGTPSLPPTPLADVGAGSLPAVLNILLALLARSRTGDGCHLDIAMTDNLYPFLYWAFGKSIAGEPAETNGELVTGASARYSIYRTSDDRYIAAAPLEDRFWSTFCSILGVDINSDKRAIAEVIRSDTAQGWTKRFEGLDVCCTVVRTVDEALSDPAFTQRGLFSLRVQTESSEEAPALPLPVAQHFRDDAPLRTAPGLSNSRERPIARADDQP
jgi:alpha-methylacyl-CoA racemase